MTDINNDKLNIEIQHLPINRLLNIILLLLYLIQCFNFILNSQPIVFRLSNYIAYIHCIHIYYIKIYFIRYYKNK